MKILNFYYSGTGNTEKIANRIDQALRELGHEVDSIKVSADSAADVDLFAYDFVFVGSGVYGWLPGKPLMAFYDKLREKFKAEIKPASPRRPGKRAVVYCSFGGGHTGENEAVPAVKFMGQLFDHLGFEIIGEWYVVGEFHGKLQPLSISGRLGNIVGRPNEADLQDIAEKVKGILRVYPA